MDSGFTFVLGRTKKAQRTWLKLKETKAIRVDSVSRAETQLRQCWDDSAFPRGDLFDLQRRRIQKPHPAIANNPPVAGSGTAVMVNALKDDA